MATTSEQENQPPTQEIFVRADEVDAGTTILSTGTQKPLSALSPADGLNAGTARPKPPPRPVLRREGSAVPPPPPPSVPPPAPPGNVTDSLSLPRLRQLVSQFPKTEQRAYAYQYRDVEDYPAEIDEWFHYTELEQDREFLLAAREAFEQRWRTFCRSELEQDDASWVEIEEHYRRSFATKTISDLRSDDLELRHEALATSYYILVGVWSVTAGIGVGDEISDEIGQDLPERHNSLQIEWMHEGADLLIACDAIQPLYRCLRNVFETSTDKTKSAADHPTDNTSDELLGREMILCLSCLYLMAESARGREHMARGRKIRQALMSLEPNILILLVGIISRLRWDESYNIPSRHILLLLWKLILLFFGDSKTHLEKVKGILQPRTDPFSCDAAHPILTASPLDYHLFRQEITSKYPSYNPPLPLVPLELEQKSMLPPPLQSSRPELFDSYAGHSSVTSGGVSILHQPVHIATPAPSPPPSPAVGGKAGKKQNYQTNQNFPFLYPPLDSASNNIGGKGTTEFQDVMVGKKWEGSDIPASIIEAGELFASRMRMTRAMRQLWKERDLFMKYERGWHDTGHDKDKRAGKDRSDSTSSDIEDDKLEDEDLQQRMNAVESFFHQSLPDLQSLVIVLMKVMLANVQDIAFRNGGIQDNPTNGLNRTKSNPNMAQNQSLPLPPPPPRPNEMTLDDLDNIRSREISQKAISGILFLVLKWLKISHILKFEYVTQLLLDSNYVQLTLKYFAHQNLEDLVAFKYDRNEFSFWHYCHLHSDHPPLSPTSPDSHPQSDTSSVDEAMPPPIQRHRRSPTANSEGMPSIVTGNIVQSPEQDLNNPRPVSLPSVDELGNPLAPLPTTPITTFSPRQFQISIHLLRVLQKITRSKSHRILLLVQFKSSQILRRVLRVPDPLLRLYVLKLFKSQVPYCGRKWRQSNMRVITAIYLHCRPELRDEWLAGMHDTNVEGEVDEAVPLEWALRGLTFWWMKRTYPDIMRQKKIKNSQKGRADVDEEHDREVDFEEGGQEVEDDERDFFQRELDAMGWGLAALNTNDDSSYGEEPSAGVVSAITGANGVNGEHNQAWDSAGQMNAGTGSGSGSGAGGGGGGTGGADMW